MQPSPDLAAAANASPLAAKYGTRLDRESAAEVLAARVEVPRPSRSPTAPKSKPAKPPEGRRATR